MSETRSTLNIDLSEEENNPSSFQKFKAFFTPGPVFWNFITDVKKVVRNNYVKTYSPGSYDAITNKFNNKLVTKGEQVRSVARYTNNWLVMIATFLGLPTQCDEDGVFDLERLVRNFFGIQEGKTGGKNAINWLAVFFYTPWKNIVLGLAKLAQNILKLATEYLPSVLSGVFYLLQDIGFKYVAEKWRFLNDANQTIIDFEKRGIKPNLGWLLLDYALKCICFIPAGFVWILSSTSHILSLAAKLVQLLGRTVTSPIDSVDDAWNFGDWVNKEIGATADSPKRFIGYAAGIFACLLSIACTVTAYAYLLPLLFAAAPVMGINLAPVINFFAPAVAWANAAFTTIGTVILPLLGSLSAVLSPALVGFLAVLGIGTAALFTIPGPVANWVAEKCRNSWRESYDAYEMKEFVRETLTTTGSTSTIADEIPLSDTLTSSMDHHNAEEKEKGEEITPTTPKGFIREKYTKAILVNQHRLYPDKAKLAAIPHDHFKPEKHRPRRFIRIA